MRVRRSFAAPLVMVVASCGSSTKEPEEHTHTNNPPEPIHVNPPPIPPDAAVGTGAQVDGVNPPPVTHPDRHWTISMTSDVCPKVPEGQPIPPCNPPPPQPYAPCPTNLVDGNSLEVVQHAGATDCYVAREVHPCKPGIHCNPPPPQKLACP
jgi:hypothetical protein